MRDAADRGVGVLLVEQHAAQALAIADRGYVLRRGRVVLQGTAAELSCDFDAVRNSYLTGAPSPLPEEAPPSNDS